MLDPITVWIVAVGAFVVGAWLGFAVMAACAGQRLVEVEEEYSRLIEKMQRSLNDGS